MRVDMRSGAFNGRRSARGMAPQVDDAAMALYDKLPKAVLVIPRYYV